MKYMCFSLMAACRFGYNGNNFIAGGEIVTEQIKSIHEYEQRKKPIALAIVLVLLVISLIFVVLYASKSIGYQQEIQVATGTEIVESFKALDKKLAYADQSTEQLIARSDRWNEEAAVISLHASYVVEDINDSLVSLFTTGKKVDASIFGEQTDMEWTSWTSEQFELLQQLSTSSNISAEQSEKLKLMQTNIQQLHQIVQQFNFKLEGNRNAMIRLSAGFDWVDLAKQLHKAVR